ncbi:helix-turn-helix domain-containing protein [Lactococcus raffinolactis]|uniref:helix-turn-helix domain-containing protein n=1 Tax=Pseudolactococcus raffinolactis TaxID=1366 RepID=UPI0011096956|nr:helix-turn-helix transcriptional regulator [Lactococcus raffinolactis]TLQ13078.1 helix-turn-helix transcriptional regulator [Lactococcus raffinolactis]
MNKLKELRKLHNVSQEELSKKLSVTEKTISRWENEKTQIKPDKAQKLAEYFNVSVAYLLGYIDTPKEELMTFDTGEEFEKAIQRLLDESSSEKKQVKKKGIDLTKVFEEIKKNDFKPTVRSADYEMSEDEIEEIKRIEEEERAEQEKYEDTVNLYFKEIAKRLDVYEKEMIVELYRLSQENQDKVRRYIYSLGSNENK